MAIEVSRDQAFAAFTSTTELGFFEEDRAVGERKSERTGLARELEELIAALDRRVPRVEQAGEAAIARDAAALQAKAVNRLATLATTRVSLAANGSDPP